MWSLVDEGLVDAHALPGYEAIVGIAPRGKQAVEAARSAPDQPTA